MWKHPGSIALMFLAFGIILYFGFDIVSKKGISNPTEIQSGKDSKDSSKDESEAELVKAQSSLDSIQKAELDTYLKELKNSKETSTRLNLLKKISGFWYARSNALLAGDYAKQVASIEQTAEAWGIAGSSYSSGLDQVDPELKLACKEKAIKAFDEAIKLDPNDPQHKMNKALCSVKLPGENPMEGILQLLNIDKESPKYLPVQILLTQLAMKTAQWDKAFTRLERALITNPEDKDCNCLMLELIKQSGSKKETALFERVCDKK